MELSREFCPRLSRKLAIVQLLLFKEILRSTCCDPNLFSFVFGYDNEFETKENRI